MKISAIFLISILCMTLFLGCKSEEKPQEKSYEDGNVSISEENSKPNDVLSSNDPQLVDNPAELMPVQREEMLDLYNDNKELLHRIWDLIQEEDILYIKADNGNVVYKDESEKWVEGISEQVKELCNCQGKDYSGLSITGDESHFLTTYYPKTQTVYTILYSENDFSDSFWYTELGDGWYLWETPMV